MPREASKCREWEKERRDRLKTAFTLLGKLLPCYDPSITLSKADILQKAATYIEELQAKIKELLSAESANKAEREEINKLHSRIKKLLIRNEQLAGLVKDAGLKLPTECGIVKKFNPRLWSNRITSEQAKLLAKKEAQKENEPKKSKCVVRKTPNKTKKLKSTVLPPKQRKAVRKSDFKVKNSSREIKSTLNLSIANNNLITVVSSQPCFIITNAPSNSVSQATVKTTTVVTNSRIFSTPLVASSVQPTPSIVLAKTNTTLKPLTPGTLIVTNGSLLPVLPQPAILQNPSLLTNSNAVINSLPANNTTLIVVPKTNIKDSPPATLLSKSAVISTPTTKTLAKLRPKIDLTRTTQVNKVPIPASRYANSFFLFPASDTIKTAESKPGKTKLSQKRGSTNGDKIKNLKAKKTAAKMMTKPIGKTTQLQGKESDIVDENVPLLENNKEKETDVTNGKTGNDDVNELEPDLKKQKLCDAEKRCDVPENNVVVAESEINVTASLLNSACIEKVAENNVDTSKSNVESSIDITEAVPAVPDVNDQLSKSSNNKEIIKETAKQESTNVENISQPPKISENVTTQEKQNTTEIDTLVVTSVLNKPDASHEVNAEKSNGKKELKNMELPDALTHSELSNDIFAHLSHVSTGGQNPESTSPTAAFLLAFPIVSSLTSLKVAEVMEEETSDSQHGTPTLLQIGTMDTTKTTQSLTDNLTPNLLNLDNFSFFSAKDICNNFYPPFDSNIPVTTTSTAEVTKTTVSEAHSRYSHNHNQVNSNVNISNAKSIKFCEKTTSESNTVSRVVVTTASHNVNVTKSYPILNSTSSVVTATQSETLYPQKVSVTTVHNSVPSASAYNVPLTYSQICYTNMETTTTNTAHQTSKAKQNNDKLPCTYYSTSTTSYSLPQYNTFNPFTDIPKSGSSYTNASKAYNESSYSTNNSGYSYNYPSDNFNISYPTNKTNIKNDKSFYGLNYGNTYDYKSSENQKYESRNQQFNMYYNQNQPEVREKPSVQNQGIKNHTTKSLNNNSRQPVNWMTTPDLRQQDFLVPPFTKEMEFAPNSIYPTNSFSSTSQSTYFNSNASLYPSTDLHNSFGDSRKLEAPFVPITANTFQRNEMDENQFSWSPSKLPQLLDPPHNFVSSTLPTLVGDLALGTTQPFTEQKMENKNIKDNFRSKESSRRAKSHANFDNSQTNFLSVSQLVDHNKTEGPPTRIASRRNSGNRSSKSNAPSKSNKRLHKPADTKEPNGVQSYSNNKLTSDKTQNKHQTSEFTVADNSANWTANNNKNRETNKNAPSNYSAEALISHQPQLDSVMMKQRHQENYSSVNKSLPVPFLTDNLISYFPPVDIPQDNSFIQQNQNYQSGSFTHNFPSSIQSNSYSTNTFIPNTPSITTSYLPSTNFIPDLGNHDYNPVIPENVFPHVGNRNANKPANKQSLDRTEDKRSMPQTNANCSINLNTPSKKAKRKQTGDGGLPGLVDFSFLSMPGAINSPILPDEFHTHSNFLPPPTPTQLYPCKNPLYAKQPSELVPSTLLPLPTVSRTSIQHPEISPSINNVGTTSLTNFNLSTIFPEINKGSAPLPNIYGDSGKAKEFLQRDFLTNPVQVPFTTGKSNLSMSYINSTSTT